jgi:hypothetical protein
MMSAMTPFSILELTLTVVDVNGLLSYLATFLEGPICAAKGPHCNEP